MVDVFGVDASVNGSAIVVTGKTVDKWVLVAGSLDGYFDCISWRVYDCEVRAIRRLPKSDIFMVGCKGAISVVHFSPQKSSLSEMSSIKDLQVGIIDNIQMYYNTVYFTDRDHLKLGHLTMKQALENIII